MPFRLEYAPSGRAGCKATECKKNGVKIDKGELRHGTFLEIQEHQSWAWKHWGCVTPVQIANLKKDIEDNLDYLDGYEDLNDDDKAKVRQALADGHVADEDWRYDVEMNRPGRKGFRSTAYKAQARAEKKAAEQQDSSATPSKVSPKKRSRTKPEDDVEEEEEGITESVAKKKRPRVRKENSTQTDAHNVVEAPPQKTLPHPKKDSMDEVNHTTDGEKRSRKSRAAVPNLKEETHGGDSKLDMSVPRKAKSQAKRPSARVKGDSLGSDTETAKVEVSDEAMLPEKSTSYGKKSAPKVEAKVVGKGGIGADVQKADGVKQAAEGKSSHKEMMKGIRGPATTVESSNLIVRVDPSRLCRCD
ncbi:hypothetical protein MMC26_001911 [Xylographa opegraphella]|nr:hypothetical protein [Xylographa opegraphella]